MILKMNIRTRSSLVKAFFSKSLMPVTKQKNVVMKIKRIHFINHPR